jgi:hypothetical protein
MQRGAGMTGSGYDQGQQPRRPIWRRWWAWLGTAVLLLVVVAAIAGDPEDQGTENAAGLGTPTQTAEVSPTPTGDPSEAARAEGQALTRRGKYAAAAAAYESAGLDADADRVRRRGARALYRSARRALNRGRYTSARRLALQSRQMRKTGDARTVLASATAKIDAAKAAERERERLARIARDARTCTSAEKATVRGGAGTPAGCATYAANLMARRAAREAAKAEEAPAPGGDCDPNYEGACLKPDSPDYDCAGGSGDGPDYTGAVQSVGSDPYDLDRDGDGSACEG